jgi:hypothetical protein
MRRRAPIDIAAMVLDVGRAPTWVDAAVVGELSAAKFRRKGAAETTAAEISAAVGVAFTCAGLVRERRDRESVREGTCLHDNAQCVRVYMSVEVKIAHMHVMKRN